MKKILFLPVVSLFLFSCTNQEKKETKQMDAKIALRPDTLNVVKLSDTLVIYEGTCRGCAYENSTAFVIKDSLDLLKLLQVETSDHNSPDMAGGSVSKNLIIVPVKTGSTLLKMFKFWKEVPAVITDSLPFTAYKIEIRN